jgi:transglutaminase-like putative cysteine protease
VRQLAGGSLRLPVTAALATVTSAICLGPVFLTGAWFFPSVFAVVAVAVGCEVARRVAASPTTVPLGGLVGLLLYLLLRYGREEAYLSLIPSPASLDRLGDLAASGRADIERYAAPIGVSPGVQFLTIAGIGLVALAVDTLAVTWRRAALAGLPLLVLYTVPTAVAPDGVNWVAFAVGAVGFMALLLAEARERVSRWGRPMRHIAERPNWRPEVETAPLAQVGRRVGATALGLALVVPAVLPDLSASSFGFGGGFGFGSGGGGGNRIAVVNPILDLGENLRRAEDRVVIEYTGRPTYLRLVAADDFNGEQWRPSELKVSRDDNNVEDGLRRPPGLGADVDTASRRYRIDVLDLEQTWLPLPYPAQRVVIDGTWLYDESTFNVFGENTSTRQLTYEVRALDVRPTPDQLRAAEEAPDSVRRYLQLPNDLPSEVALQARQVVQDLPTAYDQALALQDWLRSDEFTYSTEVEDTVGDGNGSAAILGFLQTRAGYCVHFASTMAVMARLLDIPARVAVGFTRGTPAGDGSWLVGLHDAHSWPELYFEGVGWVAFEPTPGERTGDPPPWAQADAAGGPNGPDPASSPQPTTNASPGPQNPRATEGRQDLLEELNRDGGGGGAIGAGPVRIPLVPLAIGLGVLALLSVPAVTRVVVRRRRWAAAGTLSERARAAWAELQDTLVDHGYEWRASDSPRAGVARLVQARELDGEAADASRRLAGATEQARYAPVMAEPEHDLRADVETVRTGLAASASRWGRWRARLLPRSTRAVSDALGERVADGLDAVDAAVASVTGRLKLRRG